MSRVALDSNVFLYIARIGRNEADLMLADRAEETVATLRRRCKLVAPGQVLGEVYNKLTKSGFTRNDAAVWVTRVTKLFEIAPATTQTYITALDLATRYKLQFWDAPIITASVEAGCDLLLSEDMQDGFTVGGLTVANPFAAVLHPRLAALLNG